MGQNFDDYPDFQKIPGMPILLQHSVSTAVGWREKICKHFVFYKYVCLILGLL